MTGKTTATAFVPTLGGPKIILLDLQSTLAEKFIGSNPKPERIHNEEQYKFYLVNWLKEVQRAGWEVHIFTVRRPDAGRREATIESIRDKTGGWQPNKYWFNTDHLVVPYAKSSYLDRLLPDRGPERLCALESQEKNKQMFRKRGVTEIWSICKPGDLPDLSGFV